MLCVVLISQDPRTSGAVFVLFGATMRDRLIINPLNRRVHLFSRPLHFRILLLDLGEHGIAVAPQVVPLSCELGLLRVHLGAELIVNVVPRS